MKKTVDGKKNLAIIFLFIIVVIFCVNSRLLTGLFVAEISDVMQKKNETELTVAQTIENSYNENFYAKLAFVHINGLFSKTIGQKMNNGIMRDATGMLYLIADTQFKYDPIEEEKKVEKAIQILNYAKGGGCKVLYAQRPWKNSENDVELPYGMQMEQGKQFDYWCKQMITSGVPVLDLRRELKEDLEFYKTDHHWTVESSFFAAKKICEKLEQEYDLLINDEKWLCYDDYNKKGYNASFLGSQGIDVGRYFVGKDDFRVLWPEFETEVLYEQYDSEHEKVLEDKGEFYDVFINDALLKSKTYNNKYAVYTYEGYTENRIWNYKADNDYKVLLISDSFSRPMVTFFSLCFKETRFLDPQEGRYNDSFIEYIKEYEPDIVVMLFPGNGTFQNV